MADQPILNSTARLLELQECADCPENSQEKKVDLRLGCAEAEHDLAHKFFDPAAKGLVTHLGKRVHRETED